MVALQPNTKNIEQIAPDHIAYGYFGILLQCGHDGGG